MLRSSTFLLGDGVAGIPRRSGTCQRRSHDVCELSRRGASALTSLVEIVEGVVINHCVIFRWYRGYTQRSYDKTWMFVNNGLSGNQLTNDLDETGGNKFNGAETKRTSEACHNLLLKLRHSGVETSLLEAY